MVARNAKRLERNLPQRLPTVPGIYLEDDAPFDRGLRAAVLSVAAPLLEKAGLVPAIPEADHEGPHLYITVLLPWFGTSKAHLYFGKKEDGRAWNQDYLGSSTMFKNSARRFPGTAVRVPVLVMDDLKSLALAEATVLVENDLGADPTWFNLNNHAHGGRDFGANLVPDGKGGWERACVVFARKAARTLVDDGKGNLIAAGERVIVPYRVPGRGEGRQRLLGQAH